MKWQKQLYSVSDYFVSGEKVLGRVMDHVRFAGHDNIDTLKDQKQAVAILSVSPPALSDFSDTFSMQVRQRFYSLCSSFPAKATLFDLGYHVMSDGSARILSEMLEWLISLKINVVILSSVRGINTLLYNAIKKQGKQVLITGVSPYLPLSDESGDADGFRKIISDKDNRLFNYTNLGMQSFLNTTKNQDIYRKMLLDSIRMGILVKDLSPAEPAVRDSHIFSFDFNAVRFSDAPATTLANPAGFSAYDSCRLCRFAGVSEKNRIFCLDHLPACYDPHNSSSFLAAQMLWYYCEGHFHRIPENPATQKKNFNVFLTETPEYGTLTFFQSQISDRWWVQMDIPGYKKVMLSCLKEDYLETMNGEIPEKLIRFYQKFI